MGAGEEKSRTREPARSRIGSRTVTTNQKRAHAEAREVVADASNDRVDEADEFVSRGSATANQVERGA
jgi:predicted rRNA methylase YqxC with S4 and FtsJ domains